MKKILIYISAAIILIMISAHVYAQNSGNTQLSTQDPAIELYNQFKGKKKSFTGENMYLEIYQTVNEKPAASASKDVADKLGVSTQEVEKIVKTGDISSLIAANKNATLDTIENQYMVIMQLYNNSIGTETLRTDLESQVTPSEIFADGDTSNSDFDLLNDLNIIEAILFNETTPSQFGSPHPAIKVNIVGDEEKAALESIFNPEAAAAAETAGSNESSGGANSGGKDSSSAGSTGTNPLSCFEEDSSLNDAMNQFDKEKKEAEESAGQGGAGEEGAGAGGAGEIPQTVTSETMPSAEPDDWPTKFLCPDAKFFCITIDMVMTNAEVKIYPKTANCIACHIQKINEALDKVIKKPTSPNKITGNKMEMSKCKSSFTNIGANMNIITMAVPPPQQANEDVFFTAKIEEQWKKFNETYRPLWYSKTDDQNKKDQQNPATPQVAEKAAKKALMDAPSNATLDDISQRTNSIITTMQKEIAENIATVEKEKTTSETNQKYQLIIKEITTMNSYFKTIKDTIIKIKTPCDTVSAKPKCS